MRILFPIAFFVIMLCHSTSYGQDTTTIISLDNLPSNLFTHLNNKISRLDGQLTKKTNKYLKRFARSEAKLKRKLFRFDSLSASKLFSYDEAGQYKMLMHHFLNDSAVNNLAADQYMPYIDSLKSSLSFLHANSTILSSGKNFAAGEVEQSLVKFKTLERKMKSADKAKEFVEQRKQQIKNYLSKYSSLPARLQKSYRDYSKSVYYYSDQLREYKQVLSDPDKMLNTALAALNRLPVFKEFMRKNSMLASFFPQPGASATSSAVQGLQTRQQVNNFLQVNSISSSKNSASPAILTKNIQSAHSQISAMRQKLNAEGGGSELAMPDFKSNSERSKSLFKRLEYGTNLQTSRNNSFFPITTDLGLSIGYKINKENRIGFGASYKIGWGKDIKNISISSQGVGLRSYADFHIKKSFFVSGGFEYNFQKPFSSFDIVKHLNSWQQSGLLGISKIVSMKTKLFKKSKIQLLWDFLSYRQIPNTQPLKFRVGYNF